MSTLGGFVATVSDTDFIGVISLGALALIVFTVVYIVEKRVSATFARVYALIVIAAFAVALGFAGVSSATQTAGFTLLGTIAGYLAGTKTQTATATTPGSETRHLEVDSIAAPNTESSGTLETFL